MYKKIKKSYSEPERGHSLHSPTFLLWHELYPKAGATVVYEWKWREFARQVGYGNNDKIEKEMRELLVYTLIDHEYGAEDED